jgi:hypothetical protein
MIEAEAFRANLIPYLPQALASRLVSRLFRDAVEYALTVIDAPPGNDIVLGIADLQEPFQPEIRELFLSYAELWASRSVVQELSSAWAVRWLIAWTVSRAPSSEIIAQLRDVLLYSNPEGRELAARLIEDSARYADQSIPPQFGGGSEPPDVYPGASDRYRWPWESDRPEEDFYLLPEDVLPSAEGAEPGVSVIEERREDEEPSAGVERDREPSADVEVIEAPGEDEVPSIAVEPDWQVGPGTLEVEDTEPSPSYLDEIAAIELPVVTEEESADGEGSDQLEAKRVVNTGFARRNDAAIVIDPSLPLSRDTDYLFWLNVGLKHEKSMEVTPSGIPQAAPGVSLAVTLVAFQDGMKVSSSADVGELSVGPNGSFKAVRQPLGKEAPESETTLFFAVRTPQNKGIARMRCNIYSGHVLLQSRLVEVNVGAEENSAEFGFRSILDYKLSQQLDPAPIGALEPHRLSIMLNRNDDGTHSFHFYGADDDNTFKHDDVRFSEGQLTGLIKIARGTLRLVSWGNKEEWKEGINYKYKDRKLDLNRLRSDLINLARWGYEFYSKIIDKLSGDPDEVETLEQLMLKPGLVQIAMKESPSYVLPVALIYDYALDTGAEKYTLCSVFEQALNEKAALLELACFKGQCPSRGDLTKVCPSGFWGFRHRLGIPLSLGKAPDIEPRIKVNGDLNIAVALATDMQLLSTHKQSMEKLSPKMKLVYAETRDRVFEILSKSPHLVYFYCHGGFARQEDGPFLQVGPKEHPGLILQSNFRAHKIVWKMPRPLVFINGCHTTSLEPTQALEFISPLVTYSHSVGVIGTEITIFEELASTFAEECFRRFLETECIGEAIRQARLRLLSEGNPLGLVYIPFVEGDLRVEYEAA